MADEQSGAADDQALNGADTAAPADDTPQLSETEQLAQEMGWRPQTDYTGPAEKWKPAKDFILAERDISRSMKQDVKRLRDQVDRMASAGTKQTERMLRQQADEFERRFAEAVENKDVRGAAEAAKGLRELEASARPDVSRDYVAEFAAENPWYGTNRKATALANDYSHELGAKGIPKDEQLPLIAQEVRKEFPELFGEERPKPKPPAELHAPAGRGAPRKERTFADLPVDVKRAAESHAKLAASKFGVDPEKAKKDYAADYFADLAA